MSGRWTAPRPPPGWPRSRRRTHRRPATARPGLRPRADRPGAAAGGRRETFVMGAAAAETPLRGRERIMARMAGPGMAIERPHRQPPHRRPLSIRRNHYGPGRSLADGGGEGGLGPAPDGAQPSRHAHRWLAGATVNKRRFRRPTARFVHPLSKSLPADCTRPSPFRVSL